MVEHGTTTKYSYGCRCDECRLANRMAQRRYRATLDNVVAYDNKHNDKMNDKVNQQMKKASDARLRRAARITAIYGKTNNAT